MANEGGKFMRQSFASVAAPVGAGVDVKPQEGERLGVIVVDGQQVGVCVTDFWAALFVQAPRLHDVVVMTLEQLKKERDADPLVRQLAKETLQEGLPPALKDVVAGEPTEAQQQARRRAREGAILEAEQALDVWEKIKKPPEPGLIQLIGNRQFRPGR